jgi:hypothetical protein
LFSAAAAYSDIKLKKKMRREGALRRSAEAKRSDKERDIISLFLLKIVSGM